MRRADFSTIIPSLAPRAEDIALDRLLSPARHYRHPEDVLRDDTLERSEKRAILSSWASDACAVESMPALRQPRYAKERRQGWQFVRVNRKTCADDILAVGQGNNPVSGNVSRKLTEQFPVITARSAAGNNLAEFGDEIFSLSRDYGIEERRNTPLADQSRWRGGMVKNIGRLPSTAIPEINCFGRMPSAKHNKNIVAEHFAGCPGTFDCAWHTQGHRANQKNIGFFLFEEANKTGHIVERIHKHEISSYLMAATFCPVALSPRAFPGQRSGSGDPARIEEACRIPAVQRLVALSSPHPVRCGHGNDAQQSWIFVRIIRLSVHRPMNAARTAQLLGSLVQ